MESVFFYTLHKCGSTLFRYCVLNNIEGLRKVDYDQQIFNGKLRGPVQFESAGHIYGPLFIQHKESLINFTDMKLLNPVFQSDFIRNKTAVFLLRDPRDILVSSYFSFGFTHVLSPVPEIRQIQEANRERHQATDIDEYILSRVDEMRGVFERLRRLNRACEQSVVLKYEDMIHDFDLFAERLTHFIPLSQQVLDELFQQSRPKEKPDNNSHKRSGKTRGFEDDLKPETIELLNESLATVLRDFKFAV